jgi:RHS repeat-associated protein
MPLTITQYITNSITHVVTTTNVPVNVTNSFASWTATEDLGTGGQVTYQSSSNSISAYDEETHTTLMPAYGVLADGTKYPIPGYPIGGTGVSPTWNQTPAAGSSTEYNYNWWNDGASGFLVFHPDGSVDRYGQIYWRANGVSGYYEIEALLTQRTDPLGNSVNFNYELYSNTNTGYANLRLAQVVDSDGLTNRILYYATNTANIKQVITPYNQTASFAYDTSGNLTNITDAVTNSSRFTWDSSGRVSALNTPYGTTTFNYYDWDLSTTNADSYLDGHDTVNRAVTVTDPNGGNQIYLYRFDAHNQVPLIYSNSIVPQSTPLGTLDIGTNGLDHSYGAASWRNSFYWNTRQCQSLSTLNVTSLTTSDYLKARRQHWLGDANNGSQSGLLSVEQEPSPDGTTAGQLTFYDYYGKSLSYLQGTNSQVAVIARRQPSGNTEYDWKQYNSDGFVTKDISTYTLADGVARTRTNTFIYGSNTISYSLYQNLTGYPVVTPQPFYLNDGGYYWSYDASTGFYDIAAPTSPLFAVTETISNTCGAWSANYASTSTVSSANLLIASIDSFGTTNRYGGYKQVAETIPTHTYTAWYNVTEPYFNGNLTANYTWNQYVIKTYMVPLPTKTTNAVGYVTSMTYDGNNLLTSVRSPAGLTTTNIYNAAGFLTKTIDIEIGRTNSFTYTSGLLATWQNERGVTTTFAWDKLNRLVSKSDSEGYISNVYTKLDLTATRDKLGNWTYYGYDSLQHLVATTNANQEVTLASYCSCGALNWSRDPIGGYTYYNYDLAGRLTSVQYPDNYAITNTYNALDQLVKSADGQSYVSNIYNVQGHITVSANAIGIIQSNSYDILDRPQSTTDNRGIATTLAYDAIGRVLTNVVVGVATNSFVYSANGLVQATDGLRTNLTRFKNDALGRVLIRTNANNELTQFQYDPSGNLTNLVDGKTQKTLFKFDAFGRLTNKLDNTLTSVLQLTYDASGQLKTRWTPEKGTTTFVRDSVGRVRTNSYPSNPQITFSYDGDGRLTNLVDGIGSTFFTYSPAGLLQNEGGLWANDTVARTYNNRLRSTMTLNSQTTVYGFDAARRLYSLIGAGGSFGYTYNSGSSPLIKTIALPYAMSITNGFDIGGRLNATVLLSSNLVALDSEKYGYDAADRRTTQTRSDNSTVTYTYDGIGQLKTASAKESGSTTRLNEQFGYAYDAAGNLSARTNNTLTQNFSPNSVNQITSATRTGTLTAAGNTAQAVTSVTVNGQNAALYGDKTFATTAGLTLTNGANTFTTVVQFPSNSITKVNISQLPTPVTYQYDANGNLTNDGLRSLSYDDENQLVNVTISGQAKSDFVYDGLGRRRIARDYTWNSSWILTSEVHFIYDGKLVIQERDTNNNVVAYYDRGLDLSGTLQGAGGIGGLLARTDIKGTVYYHSDALGNVTMLVDRYQTLEARYLYDPYGNIVGKWGGYADVNKYRFSSKEFLPLSGLYYFGGRFYDPNLQRFINRDPLQELGGFNLYRFCANSPIDDIDPYGLDNIYNIVAGNNAVPNITLTLTAVTTPVYHPSIPVLSDQSAVAPYVAPAYTENVPTGEYKFTTEYNGTDPFVVMSMIAAENMAMMAATEGIGALAGGAFRIVCPAVRGGIGPVLKGQEGVARAMADYEATGGTVLGKEISLRAGGGLTRPDFYGESAQGIREFIEVKNGAGAALNPNQDRLFPIVQQSGAVPVGANAARAGLTPGVPIPPTPVRVITYP